MKRAIWALLVVLLVLPLGAGAAEGLEGIYDCEGTNSGGGSYQGTVVIIQNGDCYQVTWHIGSQIYLGVGLMQGDRLSVGYRDLSGSSTGVVVYKVEGEKLQGVWAMPGDTKTGTETLTRRG